MFSLCLNIELAVYTLYIELAVWIKLNWRY